jgi:hypothetical protein
MIYAGCWRRWKDGSAGRKGLDTGPVNVPEKCVMYLAPARGATTCYARHGPKCSGTPCGCQDNSQTLALVD